MRVARLCIPFEAIIFRVGGGTADRKANAAMVWIGDETKGVLGAWRLLRKGGLASQRTKSAMSLCGCTELPLNERRSRLVGKC